MPHRHAHDSTMRIHLGVILTVIAMTIAVVMGVVLWLFTTGPI